MARTKTTKKKAVPNKTQSNSDVQSGPSRTRVTSSGGRKKSTGVQRGRVSDHGRGVSDLTITSTSTDTNERENRSKTVKRVVAARLLKTWKPLRSSTKKFALQLFDTATGMLLSKTSDSVLGDLQTHLTRMRRRFADRLDKSRGPVNNITNYNNLHKLLDTQQQEADAKIEESLEKQMEEEERECRDLEEEMETYELYANGTTEVRGRSQGTLNTGLELHPLLRSGETVEPVRERSSSPTNGK